MEEWKEYKLGEVIIPIKERVDTSALNSSSYISTENMLPNKAGVTLSANIPTGNAIKFSIGDVLISNIRPYFKKIWKADIEGGCSGDVICIRANNNIDSDYLYFLLSQDKFFDYVMQGAKGTKMPRGDRNHIFEWPIILPSISVQKQIASILSSLDDKIELNRRINENLEAQAQALFKSWFVDFEPFRDGEFVESELGMIPRGWRVQELGDIAHLFAGGDKPQLISNNITDSCSIPIYSNGINDEGLYGYTNEERIKDKAITVSARGTIGDVNLRLEPYCPIVRLISVIPNESDNLLYLYLTLKNMKIEGVGTTQQQLTVPNFKKEKIIIPNSYVTVGFNDIIDAFIAHLKYLKQESRRLATLRDTLLPRLMSGELKVNELNN